MVLCWSTSLLYGAVPAKAIAPELVKLADKYSGRAEVYKVNVDDSPELAQRYGISSIPNLCLFKDGTLVNRSGWQSLRLWPTLLKTV